MIVVADTSVICYSVLIGRVDLLPQLFGRLHIPTAVRDELMAFEAPVEVRDWMGTPPDWLVVETVVPQSDALLSRLHAGEREALLLAKGLNADLLLLDEKAARKAAAALGLRVTGLLGILADAASQGMVDLPSAVDRLRRTTFRVSPAMLRSLLLRSTRKEG